MDSRSLVAFKTVYELGSIARAASALFISPQGLSKTIARLEGELGTVLFTRTAHGVEPTEAARVLYPRASEIARLLDVVGEELAAVPRTVLRVVASSGYFTRFGSAFYRDFEEKNPGWSLEVEEYPDDDVPALVESGQADCGAVSGAVDHGRFDVFLLTRHPFILMAHKDHPLAGKRILDYADLNGVELTAIGRGHSPYRTIKTRLEEQCVHPASFSAMIEITTCIDLAKRGEACCIATDFAASAFAPRDIVVIPFRDQEFTWDFSLITKKGACSSDEPSARAVESLHELALQWIRQNRDVLFR